jgi:Zn-dependent peptidase ImmA (M78 family)/DNA-binding XRE family transcriptional regulator
MTTARTIASNVARLRAARGWSQAELARRAKLSRITLGKIERADTAPREQTIEQLARAIGVQVRELLESARELSTVRFRAGKRLNSREQTLVDVSRWLDSYLVLEDLAHTRVPFSLTHLIGASLPPERLAREARTALGLSEGQAVSDICGLLEDNGVKVLLLDKQTDAFFGLSVAEADGGPAVVVNTWHRISVERWIFTAAHELGHLLAHPDAYDLAETNEVELEEREADRFASQFLMPPERFDRVWEETQGLPLIRRVFKVKRIFRVSYKTVLYRLVESGRAKPNIWMIWNRQYKREFGRSLRRIEEPERLLESEFRESWDRAGEPEPLTESDFQQNRLLRLARSALEHGEITLERCAAILGRSIPDMKQLVQAWSDQ